MYFIYLDLFGISYRVVFGANHHFAVLLLFIFGPLQELGNIILAYREAETSLNNFEKLMNTPVETRPLNPVKINDIEQLRFEHVSFKHATARNNALTDISFEAKIGETIAFVGPSGSGKTTLVKILVGLYNPLEGDIFIIKFLLRN